MLSLPAHISSRYDTLSFVRLEGYMPEPPAPAVAPGAVLSETSGAPHYTCEQIRRTLRTRPVAQGEGECARLPRKPAEDCDLAKMDLVQTCPPVQNAHPVAMRANPSHACV